MKTTQGLKDAIGMAHLGAPDDSLTKTQMRMLRKLRRTRSRRFDRVYIVDQVLVHQQALGIMQAYANGGQVPVLQQAAGMTVPLVAAHLKRAEEIESHLRR